MNGVGILLKHMQVVGLKGILQNFFSLCWILEDFLGMNGLRIISNTSCWNLRGILQEINRFFSLKLICMFNDSQPADVIHNRSV